MYRLIEGRPATILFIGTVLFSLAALAAIFLLVSSPRSNVEIHAIDSDSYSVTGMPDTADGDVRMIDAHGRVRHITPLSQLASGYEPAGSAEEVGAFYANREKVAQLFAEPGMTMILPDGAALAVRKTTGALNVVSLDAWIILVSGLGAGLIGLWVLSLRPREEAARTFAICALAYFVVTVTVALYQIDNPASSGTRYWANYVANSLGVLVIAMELIWLFARYPVKLVPRRALIALYAISILAVAALLVSQDDVFRRIGAMTLASCIVISALLFAQYWKSREDPAMKAAFKLIGSTLLLCMLVIAASFFIPYLNGLPPLVPMAVHNLLFLLFFLALGVGVARYRLFDLGPWALRIAGVAMGLALILIVDALLALFFGQTWTLSVALFIAALLWLPLRGWILRRTERRIDRDNIALLRRANMVAFAQTALAQREAWRTLLDEQFAPLEMTSAEAATVEITEDGTCLTVPSPLDDSALALFYAGRGKRLFETQDVALAEAMLRLVREVVEARRAYDRGAEAERARIAGDLHDDVGARLMTSLHRDALPVMRADIREALAEMRLIIDGLSGQSRFLTDAIADLRHETVSRLSLAKIAVEWPPCDDIDEEALIDHERTRTLYSVTRELVTNVIRHAGAARVCIDCRVEAGAIVVRIGDDGCGFGGDLPTAGNGLRNVQRRVREVGGTLEMAALGKGTEITFSIPLASREWGMADGGKRA